MTRKLDRLNGSNSSGVAFQRLWQHNCELVEANFDDQQSQITAINNILDPNTLTPDKKPIWIFMESYLTGEQSDIDAKATGFGITTEKTAYDNAISALTTYLGTLTTPVAWNNTSGNTTIVDATFRGNFANVLTAKQTLLDKMHDTSRSLANTAQTTANTANTNATNAQTTANTANTNAATAQSTANTVKLNDAVSVSYPAPGSVITATDAGSDITVTIAGHIRHYGDQLQTNVTGGTVTGLAYSTTYYFYYDDSSRSGGSVTYHYDTDPNAALPSKASGRHYLGRVTTPAAGGAAVTGGSNPPSGGGSLPRTEVPLS